MPNHPLRSIASARHVRVLLAALVALAACLAAPAGAQTWLPDPGYNNGLVGPDAFAGSFSRNYHGRKLAMQDGNTIVAGIVPALSGDLGALGLVRYDANGTRLAWSNPGTNGHYGNQYVVLPNGTFNRITDVRDISVFGSRIFVLVETERYVLSADPINNPGIFFNGYGVDVVVFGTDGSFKAASVVDTDNSDIENRTAWGSGIVLYDNGQIPTVTTLMYAGRKKIGDVERPAIRRFTVEASGSLTAAYAIQHPTFGSECPAGTHCSVFGIALGGRTTFTSPPRIYLVGSRFVVCSGICYRGWQTIVMRIDSNAQPVDSFSGDGLNFVQHARGSRGRAIVVDGGFGALGGEDEIYIASEVDRDCAMGVQVAKYGQDGADVLEFGDFMGTRYGGSDLGSPQCALQHQLGSVRDSYPTGIALSGDVVAVSGYAVGGSGLLCQPGQTCAEDRVDGEAGVLRMSDGALLSHQRYPFTATRGGPRQRHSAYGDIAGAGDGEFMLAGEVRYVETESDPNLRSKTQFATVRIEPSPLLFSNGFE